MKVALIHDWLVSMRGGERCLEELLVLYPDADIFTLFYDPAGTSEVIRQQKPVVSVLQQFPCSKTLRRHMLPLYPLGIRDLSRKLKTRAVAYSNVQLDGYDLVVSVSHCAAKNISVPANTPHICYCLTPMRYIWDLFDAYFEGRAVEPFARFFASNLRKWDRSHAEGVDHFVAISNYIRQRISKVYARNADVIYPPVRTDWITPCAEGEEGEGFICVSALVPYKNVDAIILAFNQLGENLTVIGSGPEESRLRQIANKNIEFVGFVTEVELAQRYRQARAMVFAAEEDFGMTPVEAQAAGRPVIAYAKGGSLETVNLQGVNCTGANCTGIGFHDLSPASIVMAVRSFLDQQHQFTVKNCVRNAHKFGPHRFHQDFPAIVKQVIDGEQRRVLAAQSVR